LSTKHASNFPTYKPAYNTTQYKTKRATEFSAINYPKFLTFQTSFFPTNHSTISHPDCTTLKAAIMATIQLSKQTAIH
jgi:hypothetical protein